MWIIFSIFLLPSNALEETTDKKSYLLPFTKPLSCDSLKAPTEKIISIALLFLFPGCTCFGEAPR